MLSGRRQYEKVSIAIIFPISRLKYSPLPTLNALLSTGGICFLAVMIKVTICALFRKNILELNSVPKVSFRCHIHSVVAPTHQHQCSPYKKLHTGLQFLGADHRFSLARSASCFPQLNAEAWQRGKEISRSL